MSRFAPDGPGSEKPAKLNGDDLAQAIGVQLEEEIVFGRLHPRERLIEQDISDRFAAKRHVVRQALVELERLGLVERTRNRGAVVRLYRVQEVEEINAVRELLEGHAAAIIRLPLPEAELAELEAIQERHAHAVEVEDRRMVFRANIDFHKALFAHCGNHALIEAIETFAQKSHAYRSIFVNDKQYLRWAAGAHQEMIAALRDGDSERLIELCLAHLAPAKNRYIETYRSRFE